MICEVATQVAAQVLGNDATVAFAGTQGNLELNVFLPVIARNLLESIRLVGRAAESLAHQAVHGIEPDRERTRRLAEASPAIATALNLSIGYEAAAEVVKESLRTGRSIRDVVVDTGALDVAEADRILDVDSMTDPHRRRQ